MKSKTLRKLLRRFEKLPLHFFDTCTLVEALKDTKTGVQCSEYLNRIGYNYRGTLCLTVIGEFFLTTFRDVKEKTAKELGFEFIDRFIKNRSANFSSLKYDSLHIIDRIKELDRSIEDSDAMHIANCIQDNGAVFVTIDERILESKILENEFGIKLMHPKDL